MNRIRVGALVLLVGMPAWSGAQSDERWYVQALVGGTRIAGGEYRNRDVAPVTQGAIAVRVAQLPFVNLLVGFKRETPFAQDVVTADCALGSHGQCLSNAPRMNGSTGDVELSHEFWHFITVDGSLGYGWYANAYGGSHVRAAQVDIALALSRHVSLVGTKRGIDVLDFNGDRLWSGPRMFGVRVR